jgi:hypothetical protein
MLTILFIFYFDKNKKIGAAKSKFTLLLAQPPFCYLFTRFPQPILDGR